MPSIQGIPYEESIEDRINRMFKAGMIKQSDLTDRDSWIKGLLTVARELDREEARIHSKRKLIDDEARKERELIESRIKFATDHGLSLESAAHNGNNWVLSFRKVDNG